MSFVIALKCVFPQRVILEDFMTDVLFLEENLMSLQKKLEYPLSDREIIVYNYSFLNRENISFFDYKEEGLIIKNFLLKTGIASEGDYKSCFKLFKIEQKEQEVLLPSDLDALIARVDKNDPKLLDVLSQLKKFKK